MKASTCIGTKKKLDLCKPHLLNLVILVYKVYSDDFPSDRCCMHLNSALNEIQTQGGT